MSLIRAVVAGAAGGLAGAASMLPMFEGAKRAGLLTEAPPLRVIDGVATAAAEATEAGGPVESGEREAAAAGSHLLYGAVAGVFYGLIQDELTLPAVPAGVAYGVALWGVGYVGWLPAAHLLPPPWRQRAGDALTPLVAHVAYGLVLGMVERAIRSR